MSSWGRVQEVPATGERPESHSERAGLDEEGAGLECWVRVWSSSGGLKDWSLDRPRLGGRTRLREKMGPRMTQVKIEVQVDLGERAGLGMGLEME